MDTQSIAHRGFSAAAPENTLAAFRKAIEHNPDMVECDIREAKDGALVIIHDPTLDRTTNGSGPVKSLTLAELRELDAGSWFSDEFAGEPIPTLEETLDLAKGKVRLTLEIKESGTEDRVVAMVHDKGMADEVVIISFHHEVGVRMPDLDPNIPFWPLVGLDHKVNADEAVRLANAAAAVNGSTFGVNYRAITPELVKATHTANLTINAWTVDNEDEIRSMIDMGVDLITSNDIVLLHRVLGRT